MAATPQWKIYNGTEYVAACKYAEDAAALVSCLGDAATVRVGHRKIVWREGHEDRSAGESYDGAALVMHQRAEG